MPKRTLESFCLAAVFLLVGSFYVWVASPESWLFAQAGSGQSYYNLLIDGFRAGKLSLDVEVPPALKALPDPYDPVQNAPYRMHDVSYYKGAYYLYFGVTPAATLFWPYRVLTGKYLSEPTACM